jgi:hypothetical protein
LRVSRQKVARTRSARLHPISPELSERTLRVARVSSDISLAAALAFGLPVVSATVPTIEAVTVWPIEIEGRAHKKQQTA